jgi:hypothetical protein
MGVKGNESNYPEVYQSDKIRVYGKSSLTLSHYVDHSYRLTQLGLSRNTKFYADDPVMKTIDAFVCTFPASMCQLWDRFYET